MEVDAFRRAAKRVDGHPRFTCLALRREVSPGTDDYWMIEEVGFYVSLFSYGRSDRIRCDRLLRRLGGRDVDSNRVRVLLLLLAADVLEQGGL